MRKIITLFLSIAFIFAAFAVFDVGKVSANPVSTVQTSAKYSPVVTPSSVNLGNRPRSVEYSLHRTERGARTPSVRFKRKPIKYGFRLSHKNYYPPENR